MQIPSGPVNSLAQTNKQLTSPPHFHQPHHNENRHNNCGAKHDVIAEAQNCIKAQIPNGLHQIKCALVEIARGKAECCKHNAKQQGCDEQLENDPPDAVAEEVVY